MRMITKDQRTSATRTAAWHFAPLPSFLKVWLEHDLAMARRTATALAVFVLRIDTYDDLFSQYGDEALEVSLGMMLSRLKNNFRLSNAFIRSAEDRFTIIHPFSGDPLELHRLAQFMLKQIQEPLRIGQGDETLRASVGVAFYPEDGYRAELLLERAEAALRRTDRWGGNGFCIHDKSAARKIAEELAMQEEFRHALATRDLTMLFQPIFDLTTNCMTNVRGDARWSYRDDQSLDLEGMAALAERAGLISELNSWLIDSLCLQLSKWQSNGIDRAIAFTASRAQVVDRCFARQLSLTLQEKGLSGALLNLSIDQELIMDGTDHRVVSGLHRLADLGIGLRLNRVGAGPLALQNLSKLPIRSVDLAPELVALIGRCTQAETMISAIISLAQSLGLAVQAGDIWSQAQLDFISAEGCEEATGTYFAPALKGADIDRLVHLKQALKQPVRLRPLPQRLSMH